MREVIVRGEEWIAQCNYRRRSDGAFCRFAFGHDFEHEAVAAAQTPVDAAPAGVALVEKMAIENAAYQQAVYDRAYAQAASATSAGDGARVRELEAALEKHHDNDAWRWPTFGKCPTCELPLEARAALESEAQRGTN